MSPSPFLRARFGFLAALLTTVALAGCLGGDDGTSPGTTPTPSATPSATPGEPDYDDFKENESGSNERVPEAHYHHYWGTPAATAVTIFDGEVSIDADACFNQDIEQEPACFGTQPHVGSVVFDLEDDGSQVTTAEDKPTMDGRADVVFTGASHIEASFAWDPATQPLIGKEFLFYYRAANSALFMPQGGIRVTIEDPTVTIPLRHGMADPAHQIWVSRWAFMLVANSGPTDDWQMPFFLANGTVEVDMLAFNGGKESIDPPHPDFWVGGDHIVYGTTTGTFSIQAATLQQETAAGDLNQRIVQGQGHENIQMPLKAVVPAGTDYLTVKAWVNATGQVAPNLDWALKWHGANTPVYKMATEYEEVDGARVYTIYIGDEEVDPPYEMESFFRFGFVPAIEQAELTGTGAYEASYALGFEVVKKPGFTYYF